MSDEIEDGFDHSEYVEVPTGNYCQCGGEMMKQVVDGRAVELICNECDHSVGILEAKQCQE